MKNILCRLGIHAADEHGYVRVTRRHKHGGKKYHRNYVICKRCGKWLYPFSFHKAGGAANG